MAKRKSKTTDIAISDDPRADLEILLRPPPVTMVDVRTEHAAFRTGCRAIMADVVGEFVETVKAVRGCTAQGRAVVDAVR